jgi:FtsP/CotA-like multicopper oxidase with cupredoxin domain
MNKQEDDAERINRRDFVQAAGLGAVALLSDAVPGRQPVIAASPVVKGNPSNARRAIADLEIALRATAAEVSLFPGAPTRVWAYQGEVLQGDPASLQTIQDPSPRYPVRRVSLREFLQVPPRPARPPYTYLGPIIWVRRGQRVRVNFTNNLPEATVMHWHGLHVPPEMDAHPRLLVNPGQSYVYEFEVTNRAGTYWFHPHPDGRTGQQVYNGLAGLFLVSDGEDAAAELPSGSYDIPLVIQDRIIDANNQFVYQAGGGQTGGQMGGMMGNDGFLGDRILVNGRSDFSLDVARRAYRLRLLNGSNSRVYKLAWGDGTSLVVIGTDGGLLEQAVQRNYVMLAPGERIELWADFSGRESGVVMQLRSLQFSGAEGSMGGGQSLPNGAPFTLMNVRVVGRTSESSVLPARLSTINRYRVEDAVNRSAPRSFAVSMAMVNGGMRWLLNGRPYQETEVAANETVRLNTTEVWELVNNSGGGMMGMSMIHPLHIHGLQFQVLERQVAAQLSSGYETVRYGYVDDGWKDTVMLMPGERVRLLLRFEDFTGMYVYHCHNLEHEDAGMMRNYLVRA